MPIHPATMPYAPPCDIDSVLATIHRRRGSADPSYRGSLRSVFSLKPDLITVTSTGIGLHFCSSAGHTGFTLSGQITTTQFICPYRYRVTAITIVVNVLPQPI